jgi:hypothetical protein
LERDVVEVLAVVEVARHRFWLRGRPPERPSRSGINPSIERLIEMINISFTGA